MGGGIGGLGRALGSTASPHVSDRAGDVDLGLVRPGHYNFAISKSWDGRSASTTGQLVVEPGSQVRKTRVCPKLPLELVPIRVRADWPADLKKERLVIEAVFHLDPSFGWSFSRTTPGMLPVLFQFVLSGPGTAMTEMIPPSKPGSARPYTGSSKPEAPIWWDMPESGLRDLKAPDETLQWERGTYSLSALYVLRPQPAPERKDLRHLELVVASLPPVSSISGRAIEAVRVELPSEYWSRTVAAFEARPAQVNTWTIPLPDELLAAVRESLKGAK